MRRRRRWHVFCVAALLVFGLDTTAAKAKTARPPPPACHTDRPAVAHHASASVLQPQPKKGPVACGVYTGFAGSEGKIEVTRTGALMFVPAGTPIDPTTLGT